LRPRRNFQNQDDSILMRSAWKLISRKQRAARAVLKLALAAYFRNQMISRGFVFALCEKKR